MSAFFDLHDLVNGSGAQTNFRTRLLQLIIKADSYNKEQLHLGFPEEVNLVEHWQKTGEILGGPK